MPTTRKRVAWVKVRRNPLSTDRGFPRCAQRANGRWVDLWPRHWRIDCEHRIPLGDGRYVYFFPGSLEHGSGRYDHLMSAGQRVEMRTAKGTNDVNA